MTNLQNAGTATAQLVSVITPVRTDKRRDAMLLEAYESLLAQTHGNWEWLVAVDGVDQHAEEIRALLPDLRVRVLCTGRPVGAAAARNLALTKSAGDYVTSLDDDDLLPPESLAVRVKALQRGATWVCGHLADLFEGQQASKWDHPLRPGRYAPGEAAGAWLAPGKVFFVPPTGVMAKRRAFVAAGGWGGLIPGEDLMLAAVLVNGNRGEVIDDVVYLYRKHGGQTMQQVGFERHELICRNWHGNG